MIDKDIESVDSAPTLSQPQLFLKINLLAVLIVSGMFLLTLFGIGIFAYSKFSKFTQTAGITKSDFLQTIDDGWHREPIETNGFKNILVLGVDTLETRGDSKPLTDSIILSSINLKTGKITLLPLPRDLWSQAYQTKINALYTYGLDRNSSHPQEFPEQVISEMIDLNIHHTLVISMENVAQIIDLVGGIVIDVEQGFVDQKFPRTDVDVTIENDPAELFETIEFKTGSQVMDGDTALKYIRSRHGDHEQNTDHARSTRQQAVIEAVLKKMISKKNILNAKLMAQLYDYYLLYFSQDLPVTELIATAKQLLPHRDQIQLNNHQITIYPDDPSGAIEHPAQYLYDNQWVYVIRDQNKFELQIKNSLNN